MNTQRLAQLSQRMSLLTLLLIVVMLVLNTCVWLFPVLSSSADGLGFGFALSDRLIQARAVSMPPAVVILSQLMLGAVFGLLGLALATPLAAAATVPLRYIFGMDKRDGAKTPAANT